MTNWINLILRKDLLIAFRRSSTYITPLIFFLIVITFFPLALGPNQNLLSSLAPGIIWIAALLASLLSMETIFSDDYRDGTLDSFRADCIEQFTSFVREFFRCLMAGFFNVPS